MKAIRRLFIVLVLGLAFYFSFGLFVIQPMGLVPEGATILYFRFGLNLSFVSSADGILIENDRSVSLLGRALVLGELTETINDRKIVTLPYSETLYLWSTGGVAFER